MLNNMASSAVFRRWISSSQIFRSRAVANFSYLRLGNSSAAANRMISTTIGGVTSHESPAAPWLMLSKQSGVEEGLIFRFYCCEKNKIYCFFTNEDNHPKPPQMVLNVEFVGSSHGWLASYHHDTCDLFLIDPITYRHIKLPPLDTMEVDRVILDDEREEGKAFLIFGSGHSLAFCYPQRSHEWTLFGGDDAYESVVYSSSHRRLLCLTSTFNLEAWDVRGDPKLDWAVQFESPRQRDLTPDRQMQRDLTRLIYLVCWEQSGELYVVVRHANPGGGFWSEEAMDLEYVSSTVDLEVYKIDREGRRLVRMKDSLEGLAMFVGMNHPFAIKDVMGVKPNCIYFGCEKRVDPRDPLFRSFDFGVFDYQRGRLCRHLSSCQVNNEVGQPLWFTPPPRLI